jgi:hypothetical protein
LIPSAAKKETVKYNVVYPINLNFLIEINVRTSTLALTEFINFLLISAHLSPLIFLVFYFLLLFSITPHPSLSPTQRKTPYLCSFKALVVAHRGPQTSSDTLSCVMHLVKFCSVLETMHQFFSLQRFLSSTDVVTLLASSVEFSSFLSDEVNVDIVFLVCMASPLPTDPI